MVACDVAQRGHESSSGALDFDASVAAFETHGTAMGDEAIVKPIFDRRARERDALGSVAAAFNDVLASQHGAAALDALPDRDAVPCRAAIEAVETYRQRAANRTPDQIDESLRTYAAFVAREWQLAKKAAARR